MNEPTQAGSTSGNALAAPKPPTELERLGGNLDEQDQLLSSLYSKLSPVSNRLPSTDADKAVYDGHHVGTLADRVSDNNRKVREILESLVV